MILSLAGRLGLASKVRTDTSDSYSSAPLQDLEQGLAERRGRGRDADASGLHRGDLVFSAPLAARDDRARVPHGRPGGAVRPAMNPTMGFLVFEDLMKS